MTKQWKFGIGNCAFDRIGKGTAYPARVMLKLPVFETVLFFYYAACNPIRALPKIFGVE